MRRRRYEPAVSPAHGRNRRSTAAKSLPPRIENSVHINRLNVSIIAIGAAAENKKASSTKATVATLRLPLVSGAFDRSGRLRRRLSAAWPPRVRWACRITKCRKRSDEVRRNDRTGHDSRGSGKRRAIGPLGVMTQTRSRPWRSGSNPAAAASINASSPSGQSARQTPSNRS